MLSPQGLLSGLESIPASVVTVLCIPVCVCVSHFLKKHKIYYHGEFVERLLTKPLITSHCFLPKHEMNPI